MLASHIENGKKPNLHYKVFMISTAAS